MIFSSFVLWGKVFRNFRRTKKDRRGRNLRLSLHDYHSLPAMIAQTPAPRKSFLPFSPVLRKSFHERPEIFGHFIAFPPSRQSPGAKFGSSCAEVFHKRPCGPLRLCREPVPFVSLCESFNRFLIISLDVLICRYSPLFRAFPALFISEEPHKSFYYPSCFRSQK